MIFTELATQETVEKTVAGLKSRGVEAIVVENKEQALEKIKELIPKGASVNNGSSTTLQQIGLVDYLKGEAHGWNNLHEAVVAEKDPAKQAEARNRALFAEYYLGSAHALSADGQMVIASASGSQIPPLSFTARNIILVIGTQKITPDLESAMQRLYEHVVPLEDQRMKSTGAAGTIAAKVLLFEQEPAFMGRKVRVVLVKEQLGF